VQLPGQLEHRQTLAHKLLRDAEPLGHPLAGQAAVDQALERLGLLQDGQVDARHVRDQRDVEGLGGLVGLADDDGDLDD